MTHDDGRHAIAMNLFIVQDFCAVYFLNKGLYPIFILLAVLYYNKNSVCVCVCVCERERERERENKLSFYIHMYNVSIPLFLKPEVDHNFLPPSNIGGV